MIVDLIRTGESKTVEFKENFPQKNQIVKTVCAFANRAGGYLLIGVDDNGEVKGIDQKLIDSYLDSISNIIHDSIFPMLIPELYTYRIGNKDIIVIQVFPGNSLPYYLKSEGKLQGTYVRVGRTNRLADGEMLQELERRRLNKAFDEDICREIDEVVILELNRVLGNTFSREIGEEKLKNLGLVIISGNIRYLSNAAEIILGRMDNCRIKCARFAGDTSVDFTDRKDYSGNIFEQIEAAIGFIKNHINLAGIISENGLKRRDIFEIPEVVLREGIINATVHRDYSISGSDIKIAVYDSRIEIVSPGGLPKTITVEEIYAGRSEIRNKVISRVFREAGIIEEWGSGIPRIRDLSEKEGLKPPVLSEDGMFVRLTIFRRVNGPAKYERLSQNILYTTSDDGDISKNSEIIMETEQIYKLVQKNGDLTVKDISAMTGISIPSVQRRLQTLQNNGKIRRAGSKKSGRWAL